MRKSIATLTAAAAAAVFFAGLAGYAQVREKQQKPAAPAKKAADAPQAPADQEKKPAATSSRPAAAEDDDSADELAIRKGAEAFVAAYNDHDAKAVAGLFALKAEITDEDGNLVKGREAIEQDYAKIFETYPNCRIEVDIDSVRVLTPNIAVEEGLIRGEPVPDAGQNLSSYVAVHVKVDGQWLIGSVKDFEADSPQMTANDRLQELAWLVGEWIEESPDSVVHSVCRWHDNNNFLMQEFRVQVSGQVAMSGTMRIGWDAVRKQFKSWVFDSHGGHSEGMWLRDGEAWIVKSHGSTSTGEAASATYIYRQIDEDTLGWRSFDRIVDGERLDDIDEIVIKRRPPAPLE